MARCLITYAATRILGRDTFAFSRWRRHCGPLATDGEVPASRAPADIRTFAGGTLLLTYIEK